MSSNETSQIPIKFALEYLRYHKRTIIFSILGTSGMSYLIIQLKKLYMMKYSPNIKNGDNRYGSRSKYRVVGVNLIFLNQLRKILPIIIPGPFSKEAGLIVTLTLILIARTWLDIWFSGFNGVVVRSIVSGNKPLFIKNAIIIFGLMMWPMSFINNSLKLTINSLSMSFRTRLTRYAHEQYFSDMVYYKVANLDNRIQNPDQLLTQDIEKFSENLSHLYSDIAKPIVDMVLFTAKLGQAIGLEAPIYMLSYFITSGIFLRSISPPFGKFTSQEQKLEGEFRYAHSRVLTYSEEIAFYGGDQREKLVINSSYKRILNHLKKVFKYKFLNGLIDSIFVKYYATMLAYYILSRPVFDVRYGKYKEFLDKKINQQQSTEIMEEYSRNSGYLVNLSQAVGRLVLAGRDLTKFAGYTSRVSEFLDVLASIKSGHYERTMVSQRAGEKNKVHKLTSDSLAGKIIEQDEIIDFKDVPIATPSGDILVPSLTFSIKAGMNCIITGPNGCGKSSLFRILGNLWPLYGGILTKPEKGQLFYVPQKPYLPIGNLRDQVIYPDDKDEALERGFDDDALFELLKVVHLEYLVDREGGWESIQDWSDVLSGGEKQRIAMSRLFYHKPQFAILDECTSATSVDVEGIMYNYAKRIGITLITVSHRPSLFPYHEYLLKFDGQGGYEFRQLKDEDDPFDDMKSTALSREFKD